MVIVNIYGMLFFEGAKIANFAQGEYERSE